MKRLLPIALLFVCCAGVHAQGSVTGFPPFSSIEPGIADATNRYNLNTNFLIPIISSQGRGMNMQFSVAYNSALWKIASGAWVSVTNQSGSPTWGWNKTNLAGMVVSTSTSTQCEIFPQKIVYNYNIISNVWYFDADGTGHYFPTVSYDNNPCTGLQEGNSSGYANDESGYYLYNGVDVYQPSGTYIIPGVEIMDTNGNQITSTVVSGSETDWKDSAGHNALKIVSSSGNVQYQTLDPTGVYRTTTLTLSTYNIKTNFGCSGITDYTGTASLPSSISLPNGLSYSITYEGTPSHSGYYTGRISQITLPNGGYIQYQYNSPNDGINCTDGSIVNLTRTQNDGTASSVWTFSRAQSGSNWVTTITAPLLPYDTAANQSVYTFNSSGQETAAKFYQGSSTGTLLRTVNTTWASNGSPATKTTILDDNSQSEVETTYDSNGNLQVMKEHDYGSGAPGSILRTTNYTYQPGEGYIIDRINEKTVADSTGTVQYREDTAYDGTTINPCPTGASQHDDAGHGCSITTRGNPTSFTTYANAAAPSGGVTKNSYYDVFGNLVKQDADCCQTMSWNFSSTTNYAYPDSIVHGATGGTHLTTNYTYNAYTGQIATIIDQNNQTTSFAYDLMKRSTTTTRPDQAQIVESYNDTQHSFSITNPVQGTNVRKNTSYMDGLGQTIQTTVFDGSGTSYATEATQFDGLGREHKLSNPYTSSPQYWIENTFDALGRQLKVILQDGSQVTKSYSGPSVTVTDPAGYQRLLRMDGLGRLATVFEPDPSNNNSLTLQTTYSYSVLNQLATVSQGAQTRTFHYDGMGRLTSHTFPESGTTSFQYNSFNQVTQRTDARGIITTYTYDTLNRPYQVTYNVGSTGVPATPTVTYAFGTNASQNNNGRILTITDGLGTATNTYDVLARTTQIQHVINGNIFTIGYQYDLGGQVTALTYPSGRVVQTAYDAVGRISTLSSGATTYASSFAFNPSFYPTSLTDRNGVIGSFGYSADRRQLQSVSYTKTGTVFSTSYSRVQNGGNNGQVTSITDSVDSGRSATYTYDALGRLATAGTAGSSGYPRWGLSFTYDRYGNRLNQAVTAGTAYSNSVTVNAATNRITTSGYAYDANGNMTNDGVNTMTYDAENRVVSVSGGSGAATYSYRASGDRAVKVSGGVTTTYLFADNKDVADYSNVVLANEYVYLGGRQLATHANGTLYYQVQDHLSVRAYLDTSGNTVSQRGHYPFGEDWYPSSMGTRHFTTYERDAESGNDYAVSRFHVNRLGRFSSIDPVPGGGGIPQNFNRYSYVGNDPVNRRDPRGRDYVWDDNCDLWGGDGSACGDPWPGGIQGGTVCGPEAETGCPAFDPTPPPLPSPPACFAQLKYHPISQTLGLANHSFWYIGLGSQHQVISGEPSGGTLAHPLGYLNVFSNFGETGGRHAPDDTAGASTWFNSGLATGACYGVETMIEQVDLYPNHRNRYVISGPNSNSLAHFLGANSGFFSSKPPRAVGWDVPIP